MKYTRMANSNLLNELKNKYGNQAGTRIYLTIVPGILADFKKVLANADPGVVVSETYRFEDGDGAVVVSGSKDSSGNSAIEAHLNN